MSSEADAPPPHPPASSSMDTRFVLAADVGWHDTENSLRGLTHDFSAMLTHNTSTTPANNNSNQHTTTTTSSNNDTDHRNATPEQPGASERREESVRQTPTATTSEEASWLATVCASDVPVPLQRSEWYITVQFKHPAAEAEYMRFVYRRGHLRDAAPFFGFLVMMLAVLMFHEWDTGIRVTICCVILATFTTGVCCLVLEALWRRAYARLPAISSSEEGDSSPPPSSGHHHHAATDPSISMLHTTEALSARDCLPRGHALLEARFARYRRVVLHLGATAVSMFTSALLSLSAGECGFGHAPEGATPYDGCVRSINHGDAICLALIATHVHGPVAFLCCLLFPVAATAIVEFGLVPDRYERPEDSWVRLFMQAAFGCFLAVLVAVRDRRSREHFEAIVTAHVARRRTLLAHQQTAVAVAALLPAGLARRAAKVQHVASSAALLSELREEDPAASVAVTEAADMAAFQRRYPNPQLTVLGLCHLFTLFDIGTQVFGVERAGTFGDAYLVTAGLCASDHFATATVADLARYALWQLGLDEIATLPLRSCIVTGRLRGAVVGSERLLRYALSGPALAVAVRALKAVPAQQVWACVQTAAACGLKLEASTRFVNLGSATASEQPVAPDDSAKAPVGGDDATSPPISCTFVSLSAADLIADHAAPLVENVASQSMSIARDGRAGSHYSVQSDRLVRATVEERSRNRRSRALTASDQVSQLSSSATTFARPDEHRERVAEGGNPLLADSTVDVTSSDRGSRETGEAADLAGWRFASDDVEDAFQREPRSLLRTAVFFVMLLLFSVVVVAFDSLLRGENVADNVYNAHVVTSSDRGTRLSLLLLDVLLIAILFGIELCISRFSSVDNGGSNSSLHDVARRAFPARAAIAIVIVAFEAGLRFFQSPSVPRNDPMYTAVLVVPVLAWNVFDRMPWWFAGTAITLLVTVPTFALFSVGIDSHQTTSGVSGILAASIVSFAVVASIVLRLRLQFAAHYVADQRANAAQAAAAQLSSLVDALVPPHILPQAMQAAGAMELRRRLLSMPGGAALAACDAELEEIESRLTDLANVLRGDHADAAVDQYDEVVVAHVTLHYRHAAEKDLLEELWSTIEACLAMANEAYRADREPGSTVASPAPKPVAAASSDQPPPTPSSAVVRDDVSNGGGEDERASPLTIPPEDDDLPASRLRVSDPFATSNPLTTSGARQVPALLLVSHLRNSLVVVGPLGNRRDRTITAAGAAARFVGLLAERAGRHAGVRLSAGLAAGEAAASLLGRGTMRYGVVGVAIQHAAALAAAAEGVSDAVGGSSVVAATEHFAARYRASGERTLSGLEAAERAWAIRGVGRVRPHVWQSEPWAQ